MLKLSTCLLAVFLTTNIHAEEVPFIYVNGEKTTEFTHGGNKIIINNSSINSSNSDKSAIEIPENENIKSIVVRNVRVNARNLDINGNNEMSGVVSIFSSAKTRLSVKDLRITSFNTNISNSTSGNTSCAAIYCQKANGEVKSEFSIKAKGFNKIDAKLN